MSRKNQYSKRSKRKSLLGNIIGQQETKGDLKGSLIETGKDLVVGVIGGGIVGALIGKTSLLIGAAVTGIGHYTDNRLVSMFGVGMMAANGFQPKTNPVGGTENQDMLEGAKERVLAFKDTFSEKLFLDKILKKSETASPTNGIGDVQYFTYPEQSQSQLGANDVDLSVLDQLEQQVAQSAATYRQQQMKGILPSDEGMGDSTTDDLLGDSTTDDPMGDLTEEQNF
jgi:hypothetical protein